jgi:hypothetical protein
MNTKLIFINSDNDNDTCLILHAEIYNWKSLFSSGIIR